MLRYKGESSVHKHTISHRMEHRDVLGKETYARKGHSRKIL
jgi:hypothetical protein